eukprot:TRINITY_DN2337_c0_g2_i1.p1 TRINITY_DN2337_c0_g2~~TRINITY_DN2337_c0_g2_i1.p1  ORF type:complete len:357 (+),score=136.45 TRINITY_DN2337_c0_g2_i1:67-1137(+)
MAPASLPKPLVRTLYRKLVRASRHGRHPEVYGMHGPAVAMAAGRGWPSNPREVTQLVRYAFENPREAPAEAADATKKGQAPPEDALWDPFAALRSANTLDVMAPGALPETLPIFDYGNMLLIPGEGNSFRFFEERYKLLCRMAMGMEDEGKAASKKGGGNGQGFFLLRAGRDEAWATLAKIVDGGESPENGEWFVRVIGGPRVTIDTEDAIEVAPHPLARATQYTLLHDEADPVDDVAGNFAADGEARYAALRRDILERLAALTDLPRVLSTSNLPPVDPEAFSFWALRFVIPPADAPARLRWLGGCHSTSERLAHVQELLQRFSEEKASREQQAQEGKEEDGAAAATGASTAPPS